MCFIWITELIEGRRARPICRHLRHYVTEGYLRMRLTEIKSKQGKERNLAGSIA